MGPSEAARQTGVSPDTLRRWLRDYSEFFSPSANPGAGKERHLTPHDQRLALLISNLRNAGLSHRDIQARLEESRAAGYEDLPPLPDQGVGSIPSDVAAARAKDLVDNAILQRELAHMQQALSQSREQVKLLEAELQEARASEQGQTSRVHDLEVELATARGELTTLQARLEGYAFGGSRPVAPALLIVAALAAGAALLMVFYVLISLLG